MKSATLQRPWNKTTKSGTVATVQEGISAFLAQSAFMKMCQCQGGTHGKAPWSMGMGGTGSPKAIPPGAVSSARRREDQSQRSEAKVKRRGKKKSQWGGKAPGEKSVGHGDMAKQGARCGQARIQGSICDHCRAPVSRPSRMV